MAVNKAKDKLSPVNMSCKPYPKLVIKSKTRAMRAPKTAVSRENFAEKSILGVNLRYRPPNAPAIIMPAIWKGMFKPPNPYGETNPLTSITKLPKNAPITSPSANPTTNEKKDVNSTFGGLGAI